MIHTAHLLVHLALFQLTFDKPQDEGGLSDGRFTEEHQFKLTDFAGSTGGAVGSRVRSSCRHDDSLSLSRWTEGVAVCVLQQKGMAEAR